MNSRASMTPWLQSASSFHICAPSPSVSHLPFWGGSVSSQSSNSQARPLLQHMLAGPAANPILPRQPSSPPPPSRSKLPGEAGLGGDRPRSRSSALPWGPPRRGAPASLRDSPSVSRSLSASFPPAPRSSRIRNILYSHLILFNYSIIKHIIKT